MVCPRAGDQLNYGLLFCLTILQPSGHYMYRQFNIQQLYVLPTQCIYVFSVDLRTNSDYFPMQHQLTGFRTETECVYCAVRTEYLNTVSLDL